MVKTEQQQQGWRGGEEGMGKFSVLGLDLERLSEPAAEGRQAERNSLLGFCRRQYTSRTLS